MELAFHLRRAGDINDLKGISDHLKDFFGSMPPEAGKWIEKVTDPFERLYIGDEFCSHRLPRVKEMESLCRLARKKKLEITLLTPPLTDHELQSFVPALDCFKKTCPSAEVIVNDWGVLLFLKEKYPGFHLGAGRLLNKALKDPRLPESENKRETGQLLEENTFAHQEFQERMVQLGVSRLEWDVLPYGCSEMEKNPGLEHSVYFPWGYVTMGRVCWIASFSESRRNQFIPPDVCSRPCRDLTLELKNHGSRFQIFQSGNTIFYAYTPSMTASLVEKAGKHPVRLVYQGFVIQRIGR